MEKTEISDESLWQLFETSAKDPSSQSILDITQQAADAISKETPSHISNNRADKQLTDRPQSEVAEDEVVDEQLEEFTPHVLDTVLEEDSRESSSLQNSQTAVSSATGIVKVKAKTVRQVKSPFDVVATERPAGRATPPALSREPIIVKPVQLDSPVPFLAPTIDRPIRKETSYPQPTKTDHQFQPITDSVTSKHDQLTGSIPGGFYVTVEKHTTDAVTDAHVTSTPHSLKTASVMVRDTNKRSSGESIVSAGESSSSCQSSFDIPKPADPVDGGNLRAGERLPSMKQGRGPNTYPNPQLMVEDVQVRRSDLRQRQQALRSITAKQAESRVHRSKYSVPVTRVTSADGLQTGSGSSSAPPQQSTSAPLLTSQNITVHHELVASDFVSSLLERLMGKEGTAPPTREDNADLREIKSLENKLQSTETELNAIKQQMSLQQRDDQSKLLSELVYSQRSLQNQLLSLKSTSPAVARQGAGMQDALRTPAPRSRLPAAAQPEESPAGGFMEQVVRSYPSPVSPQKVPVTQSQHREGVHSPPTRLSPLPILKNSPNRTSPAHSPNRRADERKVKVEEDNSRQIRQLTEKVQKLMDEQRMDSLNVEKALQKEAPIDRFLSDIRLANEGGGVHPPLVHAERDKRRKGIPHDELDATFLLPDTETPSLTDQLKRKLDKLRQRQQQSEENMATVLAMRARGSNYLNTDDFVCDEDTRLHKLVKAHLDRAEADVQKQVSQIDFLPKPLHDRNVTSTQQPIKYRTAAQRLKAVQAKIDTGIARKPLRAVDKENEMEPVDLTKDDNYMRRVYGKALYHAQRRTVERAKPDSPTRPVPYKMASERRVRSEKVQVGDKTQTRRAQSKGATAAAKPQKSRQAMAATAAPKYSTQSQLDRNVKSKRTVATGISERGHFTPTTILGSGMRVGTEDPTTLVLDVLPLPPDSEASTASEATEDSDRGRGQTDKKQTEKARKRSAITVDKVETASSVSGASGARNVNNNARSPVNSGSEESEAGSRRQQGGDDSATSEWQESAEDSTSQRPLMMTADSLDLSAVTPAAAEGQKSGSARSKGQSHSTPIEQTASIKQPRAAERRAGQQKTLAASHEPASRAWEEFENDAEARGSVQEDKSRSDDIITPPTTLPGYQYRKEEQAPAALVMQTPLTRHRDLYSTGQRQQEVGGASRYPREQWEVDPVVERPLYDPTEMATRDWLEQRIMAKCIERMVKEYPVRKPVQDPTSRIGRDESPPDSVDNTLVAGAMAEGGAAQVYVHAGKVINTEQVKHLMRECLADKIRTMLGTREMLERVPGDVTRPAGQPAPAIDATVQSGTGVDGDADRYAVPMEPAKPVERIPTPEPSPPSTPVDAAVARRVAVTPEPSPPSTPAEIFSDVVGKSLDVSVRRSTERRLGAEVRPSARRMPTTPFDLHRQQSNQSQQLQEDEVRIEQEVVPPTPATPAPLDTTDVGDVARSLDEKLHLSQVSLWDTLSGAHTQDSVLDELPPFEMRYSIDTPEPTPPSSPPQAVSVQTSLTEQVLEAKLRASAADNGAEATESRQQTPIPATRTSQPNTPLHTSSAPPELIQVQPIQSAPGRVTPVQSQVIHVAPSQSEHDSPGGSTSTVTDTQMNTVSEGEWILKSDGQITPRGEATLADLSLASSEDETEHNLMLK